MFFLGILSVDEAIEKMGFGPFQILVTIFCGLLWVCNLGVLSIQFNPLGATAILKK